MLNPKDGGFSSVGGWGSDGPNELVLPMEGSPMGLVGGEPPEIFSRKISHMWNLAVF